MPLRVQRSDLVSVRQRAGAPVISGLPAEAPSAPGRDVRAAGTAGADIVRIAQARATSMATGTGLLTMSRTGE